MKLAIIGSSALIENSFIQDRIVREIEYLRPGVILLAPNRKFNRFIKSIAHQKGIFIVEMRPSKPTWLGPAKTSLRKRLCRELQARFITSQANQIFCIAKMGAPGANYRQVVERGKEAGIPTLELRF